MPSVTRTTGPRRAQTVPIQIPSTPTAETVEAICGAHEEGLEVIAVTGRARTTAGRGEVLAELRALGLPPESARLLGWATSHPDEGLVVPPEVAPAPPPGAPEEVPEEDTTPVDTPPPPLPPEEPEEDEEKGEGDFWDKNEDEEWDDEFR